MVYKPPIDEQENGDAILNISQNLARTRHEDFDDVVAQHEFTDEQSNEILSGKVDPAERMYEIAKSSGFTPLSAEELYDGDGSSLAEPEPGSAEALYNP